MGVGVALNKDVSGGQGSVGSLWELAATVCSLPPKDQYFSEETLELSVISLYLRIFSCVFVHFLSCSVNRQFIF